MPKPTEEEFDDIFDVDEEDLDDEFEYEDDEEEEASAEDSDEEDWDDESDDDDEDDWDDDEEDDLSEEDLENAVAAGKSENTSGISSEVLEEQLKALEERLVKAFEKALSSQFKTHAEALIAQLKDERLFNQGHFNAIKDLLQKEAPSPKKEPAPEKEEKPKKKKSKAKSEPDKKEKAPKDKDSSSPKGLSEKAQAAVLSAYGSKKNRKGTDAQKFAKKVSEKKFKGKYTVEQIMNFLQDEKLVYTRGKNSGTFKK